MGRAAAARRLTYEDALAEITGRGRFGTKLGLDRMRAILRALGDPQTGVRGAHVAGTNGKGSVCALLSAVLEARGLRTGRTPSPHLSSYRERIMLGDAEIGEKAFVSAFQDLRPVLDSTGAEEGPATEFEILIGMAISYLAPRIDRLVCEVGMGGRLDVTNVLDLGVAVVTNVSLDHVQHLGGRVAEIAAEKAAIIKPGNRVVTGCSGAALEVVEDFAAAARAELWRLGSEITFQRRDLGWSGSELDVQGPGFRHRRLRVSLPGSFQAENAALAVAAAEAMADATPDALGTGLARARWPGRLERFPGRPALILDGGHNPDGLHRLGGDLRRLIGDQRLAVVFGAMADKPLADLLGCVREMAPSAVVLSRAASAGERAARPADLAALWGPDAETRETAAGAVARAREVAGPDGAVLVCGSLYLVGEVRDQAVGATSGG